MSGRITPTDLAALRLHDLYLLGQQWCEWNPAKHGPFVVEGGMHAMVTRFVEILPAADRHEARLAMTGLENPWCDCALCGWVSVLADLPAKAL